MQHVEDKPSPINLFTKDPQGSKTPNEHSNFMESIENIRKAEQHADQIIKEANEHAELIIKKAKESITKMRAETKERVVSLKNDFLHKGRQDIEKEVESIIKRAKEDSERIKGRTLTEKELSDLLENILI